MKKHSRILCMCLLVAVAVLALPAVAQVKNYRDIKYPKLPEFKIERPQMFELKNGMTVFLMQDTELPLISVDVRIRTGSNYEPADKTGLAGIFGQVQREGGTKNMTGDEMDDFLEARAASVETGIGGDSGYASMDCLKDDFSDVLDVFHDVLRYPIFIDDKIELAKVQTNTGISRRNDQVGGIIGREFQRLVYGEDSPLGRIPEYATVAAISRDDLVAWHEKYYHPNNMYLGVVGDFDPAEMKKAITAKFEGWEKGPEFADPTPEYRKQPKPGVYFIEKEDVTQANVRMGHLGITTRNPDYFAVTVMNEVLGGGFSSRLFSTVRSEKGLAYSVFGSVGSSLVREGICQVGLSTKSETMGESVDALNEEISKIINEPATDDELDRAKESILNSFVFNYDSKGEILGQQMVYAFYDYPLDFLETFRSKVEAVTKEDVARVAKKYVKPEDVMLLVVGKAEDFDRPMTAFGEVTEIDITIPPPPDTAPKMAKNAETLAAGSKLFGLAAARISGTSSTDVTSMQMKATVAVSMQGQKFSIGQETAVELPDKIKQTMSTPMGPIIVVINGEKGAVVQGGQTQPLPADAIEEGFKDLQRDLLVLASHHDDPDLEAVAGGTDEVDGAACRIVAVTLGGAESRLCVDDEGNVLRQVFQGKHPLMGTPGQVTVEFSDYREVDGRMVPHKSVMSMDGAEVAATTVESIQINPDLDATIFEVPN